MNRIDVLNKYSVKLNDTKKEIIADKDSSILVKGYAGSGKTQLFLTRIASILESEEALPQEMLNIVADKQRVKDMDKKYAKSFSGTTFAPVFTDLFSFCYRIVSFYEENSGKEPRKAYRDMEKVVRRIVKEQCSVELKQEELKKLMRSVSYCKSMMLPESEVAKITFDKLDFQVYLKAYEKFKKAKNIYDQEDVLCEAARILMNDNEMVEMYQNRFSFIHVDEVEELSHVSHVILHMLCGSKTQMFMVGDPTQCIHKLSFANPEALDTFGQHYPNAKCYELSENHRMNKTITNLANKFMFLNKEVLQEANQETCEVKFKGFAQVQRMYDYALEKISDKEETAFLYHDLAFAIPLLDTFKTQAIPYHFEGNVNNFLREPFVTDMCNFVELFADPKDMQAFFGIHKKMGLDMSNKVLLEITNALTRDDNLDVYQAVMESSYKAAGKRKLASYMEDIRMVSNGTTIEMIDYVIDKLEYSNCLKELQMELNNSTILALKVMAQRYSDPVVFLNKLRELGAYVSEDSSDIEILSVSNAKGSQFSRVCLIDCIASVFPKEAHSKDEITMERKRFYVALTRAINNIEFFTFKKCLTTRLEISPFLYELYEGSKDENEQSKKTTAKKQYKPGDFRRGMSITHVALGEGKILKVRDGMMHVQFTEESKMLNIKLCLLNKLIEVI
ncbi:MAG: ATP-dependent helicase [Longicatena sp.]